MCTLDASKAFDKVNLLVLINILYKKHFCPLKSLRSVQISILKPTNYPRSFKI